MATIAEITPAALNLPPDDRTQLTEELIESLSDSETEFVDEEVEKRRAEMESDPSKFLTWDELMSEVKKLRDES